MIIPTIFALKSHEFADRFFKILKIASHIQIDFMDGKFVSAKSLKLEQLPRLQPFRKDFEAHLMVKHPEQYLVDLQKKGFQKVIMHVESFNQAEKVILAIVKGKELGFEVFLAINPNTSVENLSPFLKIIDGVLVMGVKPGKEHQALLSGTFTKIRKIHQYEKKLLIQVDGGVTPKNIGKLKEAGAHLFNSGSFTSESENPKKAMKQLEQAR